MNTSLKILFIASLFSFSAANAQESFFDKRQKSVSCAEPLPEFTLGADSNPTKSQVKNLCTCIWKSFPENGWEQDISKKIKNKQNPGPRVNEFVPKFGEALKKCGGYKL